MENKRGQKTLMLIFFIFAVLIVMVIVGIGAWSFGLVDQELSKIDFELGNISWSDTYENSTGEALEAASTTSPQIGSIMIFIGMIIVMLFVGYHSETTGKLWILLDIGVLIIVEILAGIAVNSFYEVMNLTPELLEVYSITLSSGSKFVLNLPIIAPVVGVLIMIMTYIVNKIKKKEDPLDI